MSDRSNHRGATRPTTRPRLSLASATADPTLPARTPAGPQRPESTAWEALQAAESAETETDRFLDEYLAYLQADDAAVVALTAAKLHEAMERLFRAAAAVPPESTVSVSSTAGEYATAGNLPLSAARALLRAVHEATGRIQARTDLIALATVPAPVPTVSGPIVGRPQFRVVQGGGVA